MADYDNDTFELEDTPEDSSVSEVSSTNPEEIVEEVSTNEADTQEVETQEIQETEETVTPETVPEDNWEVRARYQQSEADKYKNIVQNLTERLDGLTQPKPEPVIEDVLPQKPTTDDPDDMLRYNTEVNEYLLKQIQTQNQERQAEKAQTEQSRQQAALRKYSLDKLSEVTKNPDKAQKILNFFADTRNLQDPALYNVMYDAAMGYGQKRPSGGIDKTPPPPVGGGEAIVGKKKDPDEMFNDQIEESSKNYRL